MSELSNFLVESIIGESVEMENIVVIYSGRFQPFHKGHFATYQNLIKKFGKDSVFIATSNKTDNQKSPFDFREKKTIMTKMFGIPSNKIVQVKNPYKPTEILSSYDASKTGLISVVGEKDEQRLGGNYFTPYKGKVEFGYLDKGYVYASPSQSNPISGTDVRNWLGKGSEEEKKEGFLKAYPKFDPTVFKFITLKLAKLSEDINLDVNVGDTLLMGKFKNKRVKVKDIGKDEHGMPTINGKKATTFRIPQQSNLFNESSNFGMAGAEPGEPNPNYVADGQTRILDKGKPEGWFKQGGYTQLDKPKGDWMRGKGRKKESESTFRKVTYSLKNYKESELNPAKDPHKVEDWVETEPKKKIKKPKRFWEDTEMDTKLSLISEEELNQIAEEYITALDEMGLPGGAGVGLSLPGGYINGAPNPKDVAKTKKKLDAADNDEYEEIEENLLEMAEMAKSDLDQVEKYADQQLSPEDVELGKETDHFFQRLNDPRNGKQISPAELTGFFKRLAKNKKKFLDFVKQYKEFVVKDTRTNINIPFMTVANKLIAKTIMRKDDFKSSTPVYVSEQSLSEITKGIYGKKLKINGEVVELEVELVGADNKTNEFITKVVHIDKKYQNKFPIGSTLKVPARVFRLPGGGWYKVKHKAFEAFNKSGDLITEGGAYGHMHHPFDTDMNLTFADLKNIVKKALTGDLELAREKTDGQALAISWVDGRLVAARNKSHLKDKGKGAMTIKDLASKFAGRGELTDAYNFAMRDLSVAIGKLSDAQKEKIFKGGSCFMNLEVIYPTSVNVIPYGQPLLVFHGTFEYNLAGDIIGENQQAATILAGMIKQVNGNVQQKYTIQGPPVQKLPQSQTLSNKQGKYFAMISKLQSEFGLGDSAGVADYHQAWWNNYIDKNSKGLTKDQKEGLIKRWAFNDKSFRIASIEDTALRAWADKIEKTDLAKISKQNTMKFEEIFLGVGADVLSFMESVLTADPKAATKEIVANIKQTIADIRKGGDQRQIDKLELELKRIQKIGGLKEIVPIEGLVFVYNGNTFKLTGKFAVINQILGIFKFAR